MSNANILLFDIALEPESQVVDILVSATFRCYDQIIQFPVEERGTDEIYHLHKKYRLTIVTLKHNVIDGVR